MGGASSSNECSASLKSAAGTSAGSELQKVKVWEGDLFDGSGSSTTLVTKLEGYMDPAVANLVSTWPASLTVCRFLGDYLETAKEVPMFGENYPLIFRPKENHVFFQKLRSVQQCAFVFLPAQTILLYVSAEDCSQVNGYLFYRRRPFAIKWLSVLSNKLYPKTWLVLLADLVAQRSRQDNSPLGPVSMPVLFWKGALFGGPGGGKPVRICVLEGFVQAGASKDFASDWPDELHIVGPIHPLKKRMIKGLKKEYLFFQWKGGYGFLLRLHFSKMWLVVKLPSQMMILVAARPDLVVGILFPADAAIWAGGLGAGKRNSKGPRATTAGGKSRTEPSRVNRHSTNEYK